jgi:nicotinate-nucleotide adenylyltransferase
MKSSKQKISKIGLVGGSFNPLHIGHLRLCVEILEQTGLELVQLVPAYIPPHKDIKNILPFDMRCAMIEGTIEGFPGISVNYLEKERSGPSYTFDTLQTLINDEPDRNFVFIMGDSDLLTMPKWYKGREIAFLSDLIIVNREGDDEKKLDDFISSFWEAQKSAQGVWQVIQGKKISFFSIPRIDVSSSMVRSRWLAGKNIQWLVSDQIKKYLDLYRDEVRAVWSK